MICSDRTNIRDVTIWLNHKCGGVLEAPIRFKPAVTKPATSHPQDATTNSACAVRFRDWRLELSSIPASSRTSETLN